jgi:hypothetical protein
MVILGRNDRRDDDLSFITKLSIHPVTFFLFTLITALNAAAAPARGAANRRAGDSLIYAHIVSWRNNLFVTIACPPPKLCKVLSG